MWDVNDRTDAAIASAVHRQHSAMLWGAQWAWAEHRHPTPFQVHMFAARPSPYLGYMMPRSATPRAEARAVMARLGVGAAAYGATRLLVVWDEQRLRYVTGDRDTSRGDGVVLVDADASSHEVRWCPYSVYDDAGHEAPTLRWLPQPPAIVNAELPAVVEDVLHMWRTPPATMNAAETLIEMDLDDYWLRTAGCA